MPPGVARFLERVGADMENELANSDSSQVRFIGVHRDLVLDKPSLFTLLFGAYDLQVVLHQKAAVYHAGNVLAGICF